MLFAFSMYLYTSKVKTTNTRAFIIWKIIRFTQFISTIYAYDKFLEISNDMAGQMKYINDDTFSPHRNVVAPSISHASLKSSMRSLMATALLTWQRPRNVIFANQRRLWLPRKRHLLRRPTTQLTVKTDPIYFRHGFKKHPYFNLIIKNKKH